MGQHKDRDTVAFIEWLGKKGESLGFIVETEYTLHRKDYFVDMVWKHQEDQTHLITFEIETRDWLGVFSNTLKIFGPPSKLVPKPWIHFMIIYKTELSNGHRTLSNIINQYNISLFENVFNDTKERQKLEKQLESLEIDISKIIQRTIRTKPLGSSLIRILAGLTKGINEVLLSENEISVSIKPRVPEKDAVKKDAINLKL